eukprot:7380002-Prymnesium_polylepis.2
MVPGFLTVCAEWWVLEVAVLLAGLLKQSALTIGAFTITSTVAALALMIWTGLAEAASIEVGRHIGARDVRAARRAAVCVLVVGRPLPPPPNPMPEPPVELHSHYPHRHTATPSHRLSSRAVT